MRNRKVISLVTLIMFLLFTLASGLTPALAGDKVPIASGPEKASEKSGGGGSSGGGSSDSEESEGDTAPKIEIPEVRVIEAPEDGVTRHIDDLWDEDPTHPIGKCHLDILKIKDGNTILNGDWAPNQYDYNLIVDNDVDMVNVEFAPCHGTGRYFKVNNQGDWQYHNNGYENENLDLNLEIGENLLVISVCGLVLPEQHYNITITRKGRIELLVSEPEVQQNGDFEATFSYINNYPHSVTASSSDLTRNCEIVAGGTVITEFQAGGPYEAFTVRYPFPRNNNDYPTWTINYDGAMACVTANIKDGDIKVTPSEETLSVGDILDVTAKVFDPNLSPTRLRSVPINNITWSIDGDALERIHNGSDQTVCSVKAKGPGTAYVRATYANGASATCTVTVEQPVTGVDITDGPIFIGVDEEKTIQYKINPENATNQKVTFISDKPSIATVNPNSGQVTGVATGKATITATTEDGGKTDICEVYVCKLKLPNKLVLTNRGNAKTLKVKVYPNNAPVELHWESLNKNLAKLVTASSAQERKIDVQPIDKGKTQIKVTIPGTNCEDTCDVYVGDLDLICKPDTPKLLENGKYEVTFQYKSDYPENVIANSRIETILADNSGYKVITNIDPNGDFEFNNGSGYRDAFTIRYLHSAAPIKWVVEYDGVLWDVEVGINENAGITIDPTEMKLYVGREGNGQISGTKTITATVEEKEIVPRGIGSDIKWDVIGDGGIVDIAPLKGKKCNVTGIEPGTAHVRATFANGEHDTCIVNVYQPINGIEINDLTIPLKRNKTFDLQAAVKDGSLEDADITWKLLSGGNIIELTGNSDIAEITPNRVGKAYVEVTALDKNTGEEWKDYCNVYVGKIDLFVDRVFNADGTYTATFGYENKYPDGAAVTIDSNEFTGGGEIISGSKPAVFELGKHENVFQVKYANANGPQTWAIKVQGSESSTTTGIEENENLGIELDKTYLRLPLKSEGNQEITLEATAKMLSEVVPRSAGFEYPISWSIEGDAVEKVSTSTNHRQFTFKAKEAGNATVIASYAGKEAKCEIDVGSLELRVKENKLNPDGTYLATFEYKSSYPEGVNILVGENNKLTGNGQIIGSIPSNFNFTENWVDAFQVKFGQSDGNQVWTVVDNGIDNEGNDLLDGAVEYSATAYAIDPENLSLKVNPGIVSLYPESETAITVTVEVKEDSTEEVQKKNALQEAPDIQWNIQWNIPEEYQEYVEIVKVSEDGRVCDIKAKKVGWAIIEVSHGTLTEYCYVYVNDIKVQPKEISVKKTAGSQTITASVQYGHEVEIEVGNPELRNVVNAENAPQINWSVDKPGIAEIKVSEDKKTCTVTPRDSGTAIVTATLKGASIPVIERQVAEEPKNIVFIEPSDSCKVTVTGTSSSSSGSSSSKKKRSKPAPAALEKMEALMTAGTDLALLNGEEVQLDSITMLVNNRAMITPDSVLKLMGIAYTYDEEARILAFKQGEKEYKLELNVPLPEMDTPAMKINGKIVVPIRYIAAFFGAEVYWDSDTRTVQILYDAQQE